MKSSKLSEQHVCVLGAVNGLLIGAAFEAFRLFYEKYQMQRAMEEAAQPNGNVGYMLEPAINGFILFICVVASTASSHLVYRYFSNRPQSLLRVWLVIGLTAVSVGYYMSPLSLDSLSFVYVMAFAALCYLIYWYWKNNLHTQMLWLVIGITAILIVVATVQIIGLFMVQRSELRQPLTWLLCLTLVSVINLVYGAVV